MRAVMFGAGGAIGNALAHELAARHEAVELVLFNRRPVAAKVAGQSVRQLDMQDERKLALAAQELQTVGEVDFLIIAVGALHGVAGQPEKALAELSAEKLKWIYEANMVVPALLMKHFAPLLPRERRGVIAALSARIGSISDNQLGGWYSYRCAKAALNMFIRCAAIELRRKHKSSIVVGLHPGTVASALSAPFQQRIAPEMVFAPAQSAKKLVEVLEHLEPADSGCCFAYDGKVIAP